MCPSYRSSRSFRRLLKKLVAVDYLVSGHFAQELAEQFGVTSADNYQDALGFLLRQSGNVGCNFQVPVIPAGNEFRPRILVSLANTKKSDVDAMSQIEHRGQIGFD